MADNVGFTPGSGATIATDDVSGVHFQKVKLDLGGDGLSVPAPGDGTNGLDVDVTRVQGTVNVADGGNSLSVDDGGSTISVDDGGGALTVDGTVTANQGIAAAAASAWPTKISDGTDTVEISTVGAAKALKVDVIQDVTNSTKSDKSSFTEGTSLVVPAGAVYNDTISGDPSEDQVTALRITQKKGLHVNLRNDGGTEIGTASNPVRVLDTNSGDALVALQLIDDGVATLGSASPTKGMLAAGHDGTNARAVSVDASGAVKASIEKIAGSAIATAATGIAKVGLTDEAGAAFSHSNPVPVALVPQEQSGQWRQSVTLSASQSNQTFKAPSAGKKLVVCGLIVTVTTSGQIQIFDHTNGATVMLFDGTPPIGCFPVPFATPQILSTADNILKWTTGTGTVGTVVAYGYEV